MNEIRAAYLTTSEVGLSALASNEVRDRWEEPSAPAQWTIAGLAGHLARATIAVEESSRGHRGPARAHTERAR